MGHISQWTVGFIVGLLIIPCTQAGIYKWVDEAGRTHYSDRPIAENRQEIELRTSPGNGTPPPIRNDRKATRQRMLDIYREERAARKEAKKKAQQKKPNARLAAKKPVQGWRATQPPAAFTITPKSMDGAISAMRREPDSLSS